MSAIAWFAAGFVAASIWQPIARWAGDKTGRSFGRWLRRKMNEWKP